jgi:NAD(P)-dependent dehydrogenase (short-subunit alcohol dehydrogenase family)
VSRSMSDVSMLFEDKLVVVTGAGNGIGRATALGFAANGARVVAADIDLDAAKQTSAVIAAHQADGLAAQVDVASPASMEQFAGWVQAEVGVPDVVVNNAGIAIIGSFLEHTEEDWQRIVDVNLLGVARGCRLFGKQMVERGAGGHLVNIASAAAYAPTSALPAYSATKAAVRMLSDCIRAELAQHNIGVTAICPGFISTGIAGRAHYAGLSGEAEQQMREAAAAGLKRRRFPPEKVAIAIMRAVLDDQTVVPVNAEARITYALSRVAPGALRELARRTDGALQRPDQTPAR